MSSSNNRTIADAINRAFDPGDRINVFDGATQIDGTGAFISADDRFLVWVDSTGFYRIQNLGGATNVQKVS
ncbi:MAG: hypothetical protein ACXVDB_04495 [Tumebacillaceae bacterium]